MAHSLFSPWCTSESSECQASRIHVRRGKAEAEARRNFPPSPHAGLQAVARSTSLDTSGPAVSSPGWRLLHRRRRCTPLQPQVRHHQFTACCQSFNSIFFFIKNQSTIFFTTGAHRLGSWNANQRGKSGPYIPFHPSIHPAACAHPKESNAS